MDAVKDVRAMRWIDLHIRRKSKNMFFNEWLEQSRSQSRRRFPIFVNLKRKLEGRLFPLKRQERQKTTELGPRFSDDDDDDSEITGEGSVPYADAPAAPDRPEARPLESQNDPAV